MTRANRSSDICTDSRSPEGNQAKRRMKDRALRNKRQEQTDDGDVTAGNHYISRARACSEQRHEPGRGLASPSKRAAGFEFEGIAVVEGGSKMVREFMQMQDRDRCGGAEGREGKRTGKRR